MFGENLDQIVKAIEKNYEADEIFFTKPGRKFPSRLAVKNVLKTLRRVLFPGYFGPEMLSAAALLTRFSSALMRSWRPSSPSFPISNASC